MKRTIITLSTLCYVMFISVAYSLNLSNSTDHRSFIVKAKNNIVSPRVNLGRHIVNNQNVTMAGIASGGTWTDQTSGTGANLKSVSIVDDQVAWAVGDSGVALVTTNGGTTWQQTTRLIDLSNCVVGISANVALVCVYHGDGRIYKTTNGGSSWDLVYLNSDPEAYMDAVYMFDTQNGVALGDPVSGQWVFLKTSDGGATWSEQGGPAQDGTEYGWDNSFEWRGTNVGWFGTSNSRIYSTTDGGSTWTFTPTNTVNSYTLSFINSNVGMVADSLFNVTTNGGATWDSVFSYSFSPNDIYAHISGLSSPTERWWMTDGSDVVWLSSDRGSSWSNEHIGQANSFYMHVKMKLVPSANTIIGYAVGWTGSISKYEELLSPSFSQNSLTVRKFVDNDGQFSTGDDRTLKQWHLEIREGSPDGTLIQSSDGDSVTANNLIDDIYYAVEADSSGWSHLGYLVNGTPASGGTNNASVSLSNGQSATIDFVNLSPQYNAVYRTAKAKDWATAVDQKHNLKAISRKADKVDFKRKIGAPAAAAGFTLKLNMFSKGKLYTNETETDSLVPDSPWDSTSEVHYTYNVAPTDTFVIEGRGFKGKLFEVKVTWETNPRSTVVQYKKDAPGWTRNLLGLPMPNLHNVGEELFPKGFGQLNSYYSQTNPLFVGTLKGGYNPNSVKHLTYKDVQKSLIKRTRNGDVFHDSTARCLDFYDTHGSPNSTKPIAKQPKSLPPDQHNNKLFAEVLALKLNLTASVLGKFPVGLGGLTYDDETDPGGLLNHQPIDSIAVKADRVLACLVDTSKNDTLTPAEVYDVVHKINCAFADSPYTVDKNSFAAKTNLKGVRRLIDVPYLRLTPGYVPVSFRMFQPHESVIPARFSLQQNYPNPFNPTTNIQFELPEPSVVTLKVYSLLGQEVATLLNHETMDDGVQTVEFDARNLSSGVYFYRIEVRDLPNEQGSSLQRYSSVRKMMLVK